MSAPARHRDVLIVGAGAAGLMCAAYAARGGCGVVVADRARKPAEKVRISGGGRCNFTNIHTTAGNFLSANPHFAKSALARYTPYDFLDLVERHGITWHEKNAPSGQLFCDGKSTQIVDLLVSEAEGAGAEVWLETEVGHPRRTDAGFEVEIGGEPWTFARVVVATGGPSIPKMGASRWGYEVAESFGLAVVEPVAALVPLTLTGAEAEPLKALAGVGVDARVGNSRASFGEPVLFTHRGLSGPGVLQISSYWEPGEGVDVDLVPGRDVLAELRDLKRNEPRLGMAAALRRFVPARLADHVLAGVRSYGNLADTPDRELQNVATSLNRWHVRPAGSEGFRTAEVTRGGVATSELSGRTFEAHAVPGLHFIGEVVDVTGHLGGHNFQWAWASGVACGEAIAGTCQRT